MRVLKWGLGLVLVLVLLVGAAFFLIPTDRIVAIASDRFATATGRTLSVGSVSPSLSPFGVSARDIAISNADWAAAGPMVTADSLKVSVDFGSLFSGSPRIRAVELVRPTVMLETNADGAANWDMGGGSDTASGGGAPDFTLDAFEIIDGTLSFTTPVQSIRVEDLSLATALPGVENPATVSLSARVGDAALSGDVALSRSGALFGQGPADATAALALGEANIALDGILNLAGTPIFSGNLDVDLPDTAKTLQTLGIEGADLPEGFGQSLAAEARIAASASEISLSDLALTSGQTNLSGDVKVTLGKERPHIGATLAAGVLDLNPLVSEEEDDPAEDDGWSKDPMSLSGLDAVDADVTLTAGSILYDGTTMRDVSLITALNNGRLDLNIARMQAYGGAITGRFVAQGQTGISMDGSINATSVTLQDFMGDLFDFDRIQGTGDVTASFKGSGGSLHALMNDIDGNGSINFGRGELLGFDLVGMLRNLDEAFAGSGTSTIFDSITATFEIVDGVVTNVDLNLLAPLLEAVGEGTIGIGDRTMNYRITPKLLKGEGTGFSVPVLITGPWSNLKFRPDLEGLLELRAGDTVKAVEETIRQQADEAVKSIEDNAAKQLEDQIRKGLGGLLGGN